MTVKEFILEGILDAYNKLNSLGLVKNPYPDTDDKFFQMVMAGRADLKLIVWKTIQDRKIIEGKPAADHEFTDVYNTFLCKEINRLKGHSQVSDLFKDFDFTNDDLERVQSQMSPYLLYKFQRTRKQLILNRLNMITSLHIAVGPRYIQCLLEKIKFQKQLFVLELERGHEVMIPKTLQITSLPHSFRYYDPLIKIT